MHYFNRVTLVDLYNRRSGGCDQIKASDGAFTRFDEVIDRSLLFS